MGIWTPRQTAPANPVPQAPRPTGGVRIPGKREIIESTAVREVDAHTALTRGLCEYLSDKKIETPEGLLGFKCARYDWAEPEEKLQHPALIVYGEGDGAYQEARLTPSIDEASGRLPDGTRLHVFSELRQDLAVEIDCTRSVERRRLSLLVEDALNPVEYQYGFCLVLPFYHNEIASYALQSMLYEDSPESSQRRDRAGRFVVSAAVRVVRPSAVVGIRPRARVAVDGVAASGG